MEGKLNVEIGAELKGLNSSFAAASKSVSNFVVNADGQIVGFTKSISTLERQLKVFQAGIKSSMDPSRIATLNSAIEITKNKILETNKVITGVGFNGLKKGANEAGMALTNLGRIAQDAPFGFIGIQNNLNPLLESFGRLKAETGSTGSALKALGSSLIGPAGLGIALSVVSAAFLFYQQYQQRAKKSTEETTKAVEDYASSLGQVEQAQLKGAQAAQSELITLKLLYEQTQNATLSLKQRGQAVDELQSKYPSYFGNVKDETILAGLAADKYNELTTAILASAKARAATDLIVKNQSRKLEDEQKIIDLQKSEVQLLDREASLRERIKNAQGNAVVGLARDLATVEGEITENKRLQRNLATDINLLDGKNLQLVKSVNAEIAKGGTLGNVGGKTPTAPKKATGQTKAELIAEMRDLGLAIEFQAKELFIKVTDAGTDAFISGVKENQKKLGKDPLITMDSILQKNMPKLVAQELKLINVELIAFNDRASEIINNNLTETFSGIGDALGEALSGGQNLLEGLSATLLSSLGAVLTDLGKLAIATGIGIKAIKTAFKTLNPLVAIGAGVALVALGSAITKSVSKLGDKMPGFANGTNSAPGGLALVGERGPEIVTLPTGSAVTPNHKIAGMLGGGNVFIPDMKLRGEDIWVSFKKVDKRLASLG